MNEAMMLVFATLSGFITAILADPLKNSISHWIKVERIRNSLYKELISNYLFLKDESIFNPLFITTDYYKYVVEHEITDFYNLSESIVINRLYTHIEPIIDFSRMKNFLTENYKEVIEYAKAIPDGTNIEELNLDLGEFTSKSQKVIVKKLSNSFTDFFEGFVANGELEKRFVLKHLSKDAYKKILDRAKKRSKTKNEENNR